MAQEYVLDTNEYKEPKVYSGKDAIAVKLLLLLNMVPGTNPLHPEMGVDLSGRYRFCTPASISTLESNIQSQVEVYLPDYETIINVKCQFNEHHMIETAIQIDDTVYEFYTNDDETKLKLSDISSGAGEDEIPDAPDADMHNDPDYYEYFVNGEGSLDSLDEIPGSAFEQEDLRYAENPAGIF